jgi:hypothetical protein
MSSGADEAAREKCRGTGNHKTFRRNNPPSFSNGIRFVIFRIQLFQLPWKF